MARILVTGSSGFIGKHLMASLPDAIPCDIDTKEVTGPFDGIIHLAAVSRVRDGEADRIQCLETNFMFTARLLEFKPRWFLFASTCETPKNQYGFSKRIAEEYIQLRHDRHAILRLSNVYGPGMKEDKLLRQIARNDPVNLDNVFPFEYVPVDVVVQNILQTIPRFDHPAFKPFTMRLTNGIANTKEELLRVATSY